MSVPLARFLVTGTHSLLMNNPASMRTSDGEIKVASKLLTGDDQAKTKLYVTEDDLLYFPAEAFKRCLSSIKGRKIGKLGAGSVMRTALFCAEDRCILLDPKSLKPLKRNSYRVDTRTVVLKNGMRVSRIPCSRPAIDKWACYVVFEVDESLVGQEKVIEELLNTVGRMVGVGDFRPEKGGPFGRFIAKLV